MMKRILLVIGILMFIIGACAPAPAPIPASTTTARLMPTELPTDTPTPTQLPTDTQTPTELPTDTLTPTRLPAYTRTPMELPIDTSAPIVLLTDTPAETKLPTNTSTETSTPTASLTDTPVVSPTFKPTFTLTSTLTQTVTPTPSCPSPTAHAVLSVSSENLKVGDTLKVTAILDNEGCGTLGLPQYRLHILSDGPQSIFTPDNPGPVVHYLGVAQGKPDMVEFDLQAVASGQATLKVSVSFEFHVGYPGPAYWLSSSTQELVITVVP